MAAFEPEKRLVTEAGYGIAARYGEGDVTPYAGLSSAKEGGRTELVGARTGCPRLEGVHERGNGGEAGTSTVMLRTQQRDSGLRIHRRRRSKTGAPTR